MRKPDVEIVKSEHVSLDISVPMFVDNRSAFQFIAVDGEIHTHVIPRDISNVERTEQIQ